MANPFAKKVEQAPPEEATIPDDSPKLVVEEVSAFDRVWGMLLGGARTAVALPAAPVLAKHRVSKRRMRRERGRMKGLRRAA